MWEFKEEVVLVVILVLLEGFRDSNENPMQGWMKLCFFTLTSRKWNYKRLFTPLAAWISAQLPGISLFLREWSMCLCVCVCVIMIRYVGCWPLRTANKACSLSLVRPSTAQQNPPVPMLSFGVSEFDCVCGDSELVSASLCWCVLDKHVLGC